MEDGPGWGAVLVGDVKNTLHATTHSAATKPDTQPLVSVPLSDLPPIPSDRTFGPAIADPTAPAGNCACGRVGIPHVHRVRPEPVLAARTGAGIPWSAIKADLNKTTLELNLARAVSALTESVPTRSAPKVSCPCFVCTGNFNPKE